MGVVAEDAEFVLREEDLDPFDHDLLVDGNGVDSAVGSDGRPGVVDQDQVAGQQRRLHAVAGYLDQGHVVRVAPFFLDPVVSKGALKIHRFIRHQAAAGADLAADLADEDESVGREVRIQRRRGFRAADLGVFHAGAGERLAQALEKPLRAEVIMRDQTLDYISLRETASAAIFC